MGAFGFAQNNMNSNDKNQKLFQSPGLGDGGKSGINGVNLLNGYEKNHHHYAQWSMSSPANDQNKALSHQGPGTGVNGMSTDISFKK
jgi:hypothetical protein